MNVLKQNNILAQMHRDALGSLHSSTSLRNDVQSNYS